MKKVSKIAYPIIGIFALLGGIAAGVTLIKKPLFFKEKAAGTVMLYIDPASQTKRENESITFNIKLDTNGKVITALDISISFDKSVLDINNIQPAAGIANLNNYLPGNGFDNLNGKIKFGAYTLDKTKGVNGAPIDVLTVTGKLKASVPPGSYSITFLPESALAASGETTNVLQTTTAGTIVINIKGDLDGDGDVDIIDVGILIDNYRISPLINPRADIDGDGDVDIVDLGILIDHYGSS